MEYVGLDHVQLAMPPGGETAARAFYAGVLGMAEVSPPAPLRGLWFRAGSAELHLDVDEGFRPSAQVHPAMRVHGLTELAVRCAAAGHAPRPDDRYPGRSRFYVADPFGNQLELLELREALD